MTCKNPICRKEFKPRPNCPKQVYCCRDCGQVAFRMMGRMKKKEEKEKERKIGLSKEIKDEGFYPEDGFSVSFGNSGPWQRKVFRPKLI